MDVPRGNACGWPASCSRQTPRGWTRTAIRLVAATAVAVLAAGPASAGPDPTAPFAPLMGWWSGEGRLGFKEGKVEAVRCRVTYLAGETPHELRQNIRCATPSGKVEVRSEISHSDGKLTGSWIETVYELSGSVEGELTARGYRVRVAGENLLARMEVVVMENRQVIEIQFQNATLIGLSLILNKG